MSAGAGWRQQQEQEEQQLWEIERRQIMFCDEAFGDKLITMPGLGVIGVILGDAKTKMELWAEKDQDFCYGNVPADYTPLQVKVAMKFYKDGYEFGEIRGRDNAQHAIRKALGFFSTGRI